MNNLKNLRGTVDLLPDQLIKWQNVEKILLEQLARASIKEIRTPLLEINKNKENQHCGTKPKKIAFGIAPLGIVSIGIVPMGVISIGIVPMGVFSFGAVAMGIVNLSVVGMGIISAGVTTMGIWAVSYTHLTLPTSG